MKAGACPSSEDAGRHGPASVGSAKVSARKYHLAQCWWRSAVPCGLERGMLGSSFPLLLPGVLSRVFNRAAPPHVPCGGSESAPYGHRQQASQTENQNRDVVRFGSEDGQQVDHCQNDDGGQERHASGWAVMVCWPTGPAARPTGQLARELRPSPVAGTTVTDRSAAPNEVRSAGKVVAGFRSTDTFPASGRGALLSARFRSVFMVSSQEDFRQP